MEAEQFTEQQLIDFAQQHGCTEVSHWKLERWHKEDVIPRPQVEHLGQGKGTSSMYPIQTGPQMLAVCRLLKSTRNFDVVRFQLWQEGYRIPLPILKQALRQLAILLQWKIPHGEERKYNAVERRLGAFLRNIRNRFFRFLLRQLGKSLENLQSFMYLHLSLLYGIPLIFEPSHDDRELSLADIFAQGLGLEELSFLPKDLTPDLQRFSDYEVFSITRMNARLDKATEEDLRRASKRTELIALMLESFELMGILPSLLLFLLRSVSSPHFQALTLVFFLRLEECGYSNNMDGLLKVCQIQVPRFRTFQALFLTLEQEVPPVAKALGNPQKLWGQIKNLSEPERERYLAQKTEYLRTIYLQHQTEINDSLQRHPEIENFLDEDAHSSESY